MTAGSHGFEIQMLMTVSVPAGVKVEFIHEETKTKHHISKLFICRGRCGETTEKVCARRSHLSPVLNSVISQMKDEKPAGSSRDSSAPEPSPFVPPSKPQKRDRPSTFSPTEDSFKDTATLVKEDIDV